MIDFVIVGHVFELREFNSQGIAVDHDDLISVQVFTEQHVWLGCPVDGNKIGLDPRFSEPLPALARLEPVESDGVNVEPEVCRNLHQPRPNLRVVDFMTRAWADGNGEFDNQLEPALDDLRAFRICMIDDTDGFNDCDPTGVPRSGQIDVNPTRPVSVVRHICFDPSRHTVDGEVDIALVDPLLET